MIFLDLPIAVPQAKEKSPDLKLLCPDIFWWGGGLSREGVGPKGSACPSKPRKTKHLGGVSRDFGWDIPGVPEKFEKESVEFCAPSCIYFGIVLAQVLISLRSSRAVFRPDKACCLKAILVSLMSAVLQNSCTLP